jgi:hypothetical protein
MQMIGTYFVTRSLEKLHHYPALAVEGTVPEIFSTANVGGLEEVLGSIPVYLMDVFCMVREERGTVMPKPIYWCKNKLDRIQ